MLTLFRSNRAEWLAEVLASQLRQTPPPPFETVQVVVNTWPTSRWLGERLAIGLGGIAANIRFPFPGSHLRSIVNGVLDQSPGLADPWRASELVWPVLDVLPELVKEPEAEPLRAWLQRRHPGQQHLPGALDLAGWQLGRAIADALDDAALYRADQLARWWEGQPGECGSMAWQALLVQRLRKRLGVKPFGLRLLEAIDRLQRQPPPAHLPEVLRFFGLSSMAPLQVQLLQALALHCQVDLYLLTPGPDLWQRCGSRRALLSDALALRQPLEADWLLQSSGLEARFGRLGGEFQQLLEGSGEVQLGVEQERDLFADPTHGVHASNLLHQLQRQLVLGSGDAPPLRRQGGDPSLEFHACPGRLRQVQIVRDRILQLLAADSSLEPRDVLVMTPNVDSVAPLVASVFGDRDATGVDLPWRLTDRSQQSEAGLARSLLQLLRLAAERLTASGLEALLEKAPLERRFQLGRQEIALLHRELQQLGFRWGLDAAERGGQNTGSLAWACDRLLLGLVLPQQPGLAPAGTAPFPSGHGLELVGRWLHLLERLRHWLMELRRPRSCAAWVELLQELLEDLFGNADDCTWEWSSLLAAIDDWQRAGRDCALELPAAVVAAGLDERLGADSGRFGHRSGALTISALEPMRAIPHRVIVLMGLDAGTFPRQQQRPGFHPLEQERRLGDPSPADQDRYVLLEALLSARDHLLVTWCSRDERRGENLPPAAPVRQWIDWLQQQLEGESGADLVVNHPANPLDCRNFLPTGERQPPSCDHRLLAARQLLEHPGSVQPPQPLACSAGPPPSESTDRGASPDDPYTDLRDWLVAPQACWLEQLGLQPQEWADSINDLDMLCLDERQRARLLRQGLAAAPEWTAELATPDHWLHSQRGQASLPPLAAADLEASLLAERWRDLNRSLQLLGPTQDRRQLAWGTWQQDVDWRGDSLVLLHTARGRSRHLLDLWLQLLLASAAGAAPRQAVLVARGEKGFGVIRTLRPPGAEPARAELERLAALRQEWRQRCWPVPPETGWAWVERGKGAAIEAWEGAGMRPGERQQPEQALCFGPERPALELLAGEFHDLATAWLEPLRQHLQGGKP